MRNKKHILVTGGAGFIGSHLVDYLISADYDVVVLDKLTYAGDLNNLSKAEETGRLRFIQGDICDPSLVLSLLQKYHIHSIFHLAAESHVDNSISNPENFILTNVNGTCSILKAAHDYWQALREREDFRFVHVSTDEVFGHLTDKDPPFTENTPYAPNSPYSASKASSDHFARAWYRTYGLPVIITNCSNNYGPRQHKEKLIPTIIRNALCGNPIPIYGRGENIRDWLYVEDHCKGLYLALIKGKPGENYCLGGNNEIKNITMAELICGLMDSIIPRPDGKRYKEQITFVEDRKGHDWRYAINASKAKNELSFSPSTDYPDKLLETVRYYIQREEKTDKSSEKEKLNDTKEIDLAAIELNYEGFRQLAQNKNLSSRERIGFPDNYRLGFEKVILEDIAVKLELTKRAGANLLDIGCGASPMTSALLDLCYANKVNITLNDSPEMLNLVKSEAPHHKIPGKFPEILEYALKMSPRGYELILCYSVLHYIFIDSNIFDFIDSVILTLKPNGIALIGDIPNQTKRKRFFSSQEGIKFHQKFTKTNTPPIIDYFHIKRNTIDEAVLNALIARAHAAGCNAYIVPQPNTLPMANRRDDLIIRKL